MKVAHCNLLKNGIVYFTFYMALTILALIVFDYFKIWNFVSEHCILIISVGTLLAIAIFLHYELYKDYFNPGITNFDSSIIAVCLILILTLFMYDKGDNHYFILHKLTIFFTIMIIVRIVTIVYALRAERDKPKTFSINILLNGTIDKKTIEKYGSRLLFRDNPELKIEDDIFHQRKIIENIIEVMKCSTKYKQTVISIIGPWGSGKTTIYNMAKNEMRTEKKYCFIYFDAWDYSDEMTLLLGLFDKISTSLPFASKLKVSVIRGDVKKALNESNNQYLSLIGSIFAPHNVDVFSRFKNEINNYLEKSGKKLFITIDNMDRANDSELMAIFRLINGIYAFSNTTFLLLYDESKLKDAEYIYGHLDKLAQIRFTISKPTKRMIIEILEKCNNEIGNILGSEYMMSEISVKALSNTIETPRDINHLLNIIFEFNIKIFNVDDYVSLNYIRYKNIDLYHKILNNRDMFIVDSQQRFNKEIRKEINLSINESKNTDSMEEDIFIQDKNGEFSDMLSILSPLMSEDNKNVSYSIPEKRRSFSSIHYNENYFFNTESYALWADEKFETIQKKIENNQRIQRSDIVIDCRVEGILLTFLERLKFGDNNQRMRFIEDISYYINSGDLEAEKTIGIFENAIEGIDNNLIYKFTDYLSSNYRLLRLSEILYERELGKSSGKENILKKGLIDKTNKIISEKINIYNDQNYEYGNLWTLWHLRFKDKPNEKVTFKEYINSCIESNIHYRIRHIYDLFSKGTIDGRYGLVKDSGMLFTIYEKADIENLWPYTESEEESLDEEEKKVIKAWKQKAYIHDMTFCDHYPDLRSVN